MSIDRGLRTVLGPKNYISERPDPSAGLPETPLTLKEKKHIAACMRVNHAGEVAAQGLYQGQALTAKDPEIQSLLAQAAQEEWDHLLWCSDRLQQLNSSSSVLNPLWYLGSYLMGALIGLSGDKVSLGFLAETEKQVTQHLQNHQTQIPGKDRRSHAILKQMIIDESQHAQNALDEGGNHLPFMTQKLMRLSSSLLTTGSYYL